MSHSTVLHTNQSLEAHAETTTGTHTENQDVFTTVSHELVQVTNENTLDFRFVRSSSSWAFLVPPMHRLQFSNGLHRQRLVLQTNREEVCQDAKRT